LLIAKRTLMSEEIMRYRTLGKSAAEAMTETMLEVEPGWTECDVAAAGAANLWKRNIHPTLTLVAGESRMSRYRHPTPTLAKVGNSLMLVFCARKHGLYANLTRFIYFKTPGPFIEKLHEQAAVVEAIALDSSKANRSLGDVYREIKIAYSAIGYPDEIARHHQGGLCGYLSREVVAKPDCVDKIPADCAFAWNPSFPGTKIEDTFSLSEGKLENLTFDLTWPIREVEDRMRPTYLVRT
jgi:Xaa-Pro aminopeptidase